MKELTQITEDIIHNNLQYTRLRNGCYNLLNYFTSLIDFDLESEKGITHIETPNGLAVSPFSAANCITDIMRTRTFLRAIKQAIEEKIAQKNSKPVLVLYAGTGPFATLFIPLTTIFEANQVKFLLLEKNKDSISCLTTLIEKLQIKDFVLDLVKADAAAYIIPEKYEIDILMLEVMREGLKKEPQVFVASNLITQCNQDALMIPESIQISTTLTAPNQTIESQEIEVHKLLSFDKQFALECASSNYADKIFNEGLVIEIKEKPLLAGRRLMLDTTIVVYNDEVLNKNESSLNLPVPICDATNFIYPQKLLAKYEVGKFPKFNITCID